MKKGRFEGIRVTVEPDRHHGTNNDKEANVDEEDDGSNHIQAGEAIGHCSMTPVSLSRRVDCLSCRLVHLLPRASSLTCVEDVRHASRGHRQGEVSPRDVSNALFPAQLLG